MSRKGLTWYRCVLPSNVSPPLAKGKQVVPLDSITIWYRKRRGRDLVLIHTYDHEAIAVEKFSTYHTIRTCVWDYYSVLYLGSCYMYVCLKIMSTYILYYNMYVCVWDSIALYPGSWNMRLWGRGVWCARHWFWLFSHTSLAAPGWMTPLPPTPQGPVWCRLN